MFQQLLLVCGLVGAALLTEFSVGAPHYHNIKNHFVLNSLNSDSDPIRRQFACMDGDVPPADAAFCMSSERTLVMISAVTEMLFTWASVIKFIEVVTTLHMAISLVDRLSH